MLQYFLMNDLEILRELVELDEAAKDVWRDEMMKKRARSIDIEGVNVIGRALDDNDAILFNCLSIMCIGRGE